MATGSRAGRLDGGGEYDDVLTGRNDARNETDCDGAVVVALLGFIRSHVCACVCARALCGGNGGGCARAYVCAPAAAEWHTSNGRRVPPAPL